METKQKRSRTQNMVILAMLSGIIFILGLTPIGMIQIFTFKITMVHIPVVIGACMLGVKGGAFLGTLFGLASFLNNSFIAPNTVTGFVFTPLIPIPGGEGSLWSLVVVFVPRIMVGIGTALLFRWIYNWKRNALTAGSAAGIAGALINTVLVFFFIFLFFQKPYEASLGRSLATVIQASVLTNFVPEVIAAGLVVPATVQALYKLREKT